MVVLAPMGVRVRDEVMAEFYKAPEVVLDLERRDIESLRDIFRKLTALLKAQEASAAG
jgi:hypothetical protein